MALSNKFARLAAPAAILAASFMPYQAQANDPAGTYVAPVKQTGAIPSKLVPDEDGVMWFERGTDGNTYLSMGSGLSDKTDGFVVIVATNEKHAVKAVDHAQKLADWFEKQPQMPDHVPVVAYMNTKGVGYLYSTDGIGYGNEDINNVMMSPKQAADARENAILAYRATRIVKERHESPEIAALTR